MHKSSSINYPKKIFSGIQPTGTIHLGNYLGAIKQWVNLQSNNEDVTLCIVDLHSMTLPHVKYNFEPFEQKHIKELLILKVPYELSNNILEMAATLLACNLDPNKITLFQQSQVPQHTELCWYFSCLSTMARYMIPPRRKKNSFFSFWKHLYFLLLGWLIYHNIKRNLRN